MESGPGGLGPVASEPKVKGPFLLPGRGTTALTEQTRVGAERRGGRKMLLCCCIALAVPPRVPQTFPLLPPAILSQTLCTAPDTPLDGIPPPFPAPLGLCPPRSRRRANPLPAPSPGSLQPDSLGPAWGQLSLATPVPISCPRTPSPGPGPQPPYSPGPGGVSRAASGALLPGFQPPARPDGSSSHSGSQTPSVGPRSC